MRAPAVLAFEHDGFAYLCSEACIEDFRRGARSRSPRRDSAPRASVPDRVREATRPSRIPGDETLTSAEMSATHRRLVRGAAVPLPWAGAVAVVIAFGLGLVAQSAWPVLLSAALTVVAAGLALRESRDAARDAGILVWVTPPVGVALAALAALAAHLDDPGRAGPALAGAAVAAGAVLVRAWLDRRARRPIAERVHSLAKGLPARVRVPAEGATGDDMRYAETAASAVRAGEEILAVEGEVIGVDGIVQAGEARVRLHPDAIASERRVAGDPVLAGARVRSGALRVLATRVGQDRALVRIQRFGAPGLGGARVVRLAQQVGRFGGLVAAAGALGALALTGEPGLAGALEAAAAALVAAPLLSARRSAESPLVAAAAAGAARGIVFHDARSLEDAGRITTAALTTTGTVTRAEFEVVEVHVLHGEPLDPLLALACAAEVGAGDHPLALAIARYAKARGVAPASVRRVTHAPGRGVSALTPGGDRVLLGSRQLLIEDGVSVALAEADAARAEGRGHTALFLSHAGKVRAVFVVRDEVRPDARAAVQRLFDQGAEVVLLSGDSRATVEALARQVDVTNVKAELLPEERGEEVRRLGEQGVVAAVGKPGLDAHVLEAADVPVHLGAAGSPLAERGVALTSDAVRDAAAAIWIAGAARREAWRGLGLAVGVGGVLVASAALGWLPPAAAALCAVGVDAVVLRAGERLLRRTELRLPA